MFLFRVQSAVMANSIFPLGSGHFGKFKKKRFDTLGHLLRILREKLGGETLLGIVRLGMLGFSTKELGSDSAQNLASQ
jgi:hypothetical protein